ncbi:hypothetical protein FHS95_001510 [Sphingomonas naasensis]|uniref:Uncharacterized protein n=1 Tax=Sphingomonas naasensis TaxID=1344951 RepID=A0A4S1WB42_9SPHN|nr:hypothetical protein [Sphingomonas naasensis]NIJ19841.1 hypothetical protein [Sphingomonas naasensis]TGX40029.1 hypothetical protein E5A74_15760 [Sphingomonas naasensis]
MRLFVFLLLCLFWIGAISLAATPVGTVLVLLAAAPLGLLLAALRFPAELFGFVFIALFAGPALYNVVSGTVRAIQGKADAWSAWSWAISFAAIPALLYRALTSLSGWH